MQHHRGVAAARWHGAMQCVVARRLSCERCRSSNEGWGVLGARLMGGRTCDDGGDEERANGDSQLFHVVLGDSHFVRACCPLQVISG